MADSDDELNDLLDDAIKDFKECKEEIHHIEQKTDTKLSNNIDNTINSTTASSDKLFEDVFKEIVSGDQNPFNDEFLSSFLKTDINGVQQPDISEQQFKSAFDFMKDNMNEGLGDEDILSMMADLGVGEEEIGGLASSDPTDDSFFTVVKSVMRNLLSKDILYPSLLNVATQYPEWFTNNAASASQSDLHRYKSQLVIIKKIIKEFDEETNSDSEQIKTARFQRILDLMQSMQSLGQPPPELLAHLPQNMELDNNGLPKFSPQFFQNFNEANSTGCSLM